MYPIDNRRNEGAKPRKTEVNRDKTSFSENNGRIIERPRNISTRLNSAFTQSMKQQ